MALAEIAQSGSDVTAPMMLASRGMKIILEGCCPVLALRSPDLGQGLSGRTQPGRPFWTMRFERGLVSLGRPCDLPGLCREHVSVVVVRPLVLPSLVDARRLS
jgi:hypothetical protein